MIGPARSGVLRWVLVTLHGTGLWAQVLLKVIRPQCYPHDVPDSSIRHMQCFSSSSSHKRADTRRGAVSRTGISSTVSLCLEPQQPYCGGTYRCFILHELDYLWHSYTLPAVTTPAKSKSRSFSWIGESMSLVHLWSLQFPLKQVKWSTKVQVPNWSASKTIRTQFRIKRKKKTLNCV